MDTADLLRIIIVIRDYQNRIFEFVNNFRTFCTYFVLVILGIIVTSFEFTSAIRRRVVAFICAMCLLEIIAFRACTEWFFIELSNPLETYKLTVKAIRWTMLCYVLASWIHSFFWYKPPTLVMLREMSELRNMMKNPVIYLQNYTDKYTLDEFVQYCNQDDSEDDSDFEQGQFGVPFVKVTLWETLVHPMSHYDRQNTIF
ncbi:hypothetical protein BEWA_028790 [Theileria equi strain WA]|uniref:Uncharacterized protein n=1 Tax=Theileria equi strain WA TaxID=1537102 RepID=L0AYR4_THEEQ|nr:hypothetical protein BEWA_028790 [Theileria equi strain WA]AFZ80029.1 hypothetical protein BEWA_028790 [Theileria equi strain WA]|eukprot:XP_004829695.1 hypothetical protein BEWA_028790 [Theileria equi strain WA]